uniref:ATP synthase complex subunit 8 n=1 Tax=Dysmicohermes ingens TaxID=1518963 RepID=A0A0U1V1N4_9NEOP|nr:ATP synthase F0 subunit 8 [Dysmicohermes ingens]AIG24333.1 ATP synthase F0 subunit 8 [Dysmicohermes ingens]
MPQMAPINWLMLFMFFSLMLIFFNILNYFIINPMPINEFNKSIFSQTMNWKW